MEDLWKYFEDLKEIVYVVDTEDHSLVYMNRYAMDVFGIKSEEEYVGKKCYRLFQGFSSPCPFCNTEDLRENKFIEWRYKNPVLKETFLLKDTLIRQNGKMYRMEIAIQKEKKTVSVNGFIHYETLLNDCLIEQNSTGDSEKSINILLDSLGRKIKCKNLVVYEKDSSGDFIRSYGWPKKIVNREIKKEMQIFLKDWCKRFDCNEPVIVKNPEFIWEIKEDDLIDGENRTRANLIIVPFVDVGELKGALLIDDPRMGRLEDIGEIGRILSSFIVRLLERRDLIERLEYMGFHDQLTGAFNRNALGEYIGSINPDEPVGMVFCDINGLKQINDLQGHESGDKAIRKVYETFKSAFPGDRIYRMGGDEFLAVQQNGDENEFDIQVQLFRRLVMENNCKVSIGTMWREKAGKDFNELLKEVDGKMYVEKKNFYIQTNSEKKDTLPEVARDEIRHPFLKFMQNYYFDEDTFFKTISYQKFTSYIYCGDLTKNMYYISDSIKNDFNFPENLVYDFTSLLEQRIVETDRKFHIDYRKNMLSKKKTWYSVHYRVYNKDGIPVWVHCQGMLKWNADKTKPLFFSACMELLDDESEEESLSVNQNFSKALKIFTENEEGSKKVLIICVALNNFSVISQLMGSRKGDNIIWEIMSHIRKEASGKIRLVRTSEARFILLSENVPDPSEKIELIKEAVRKVYIQNQISIVYPCAIGILHRPEDGRDAETLLAKSDVVTHAAKGMQDVPYVEFSQELAEEYKGEKELYMELNRCIKERFQNFRIVVQPQVKADTGKIYGGEVLLRWKYKGVDVPPVKFIPILEKNGLIIPVGKWIVAQAAAFVRRITKIMPDFKLSFNVSYYQISDTTFIPFIRKTIENQKISGKNLMIELTETHFNEMPERLETFIKECKKLGIGFALDDFGSAYSSLQLLLQYPADVIKLDREMTKKIISSSEKVDFIMSIMYACHKFGKKICVEGVETGDELKLVRQTGCDFIQGFYFYRPLEKGSFLEVLQKDRTENQEGRKKQEVRKWERRLMEEKRQ